MIKAKGIKEMSGTTTVLTTNLALSEMETVFRQIAKAIRTPLSRLGEMGARVNKRSVEFGFYTPSETPFTSLDDDPPDFTVGLTYGAGFTGQFGNFRTMHMYVWNRGEKREVHLHVPHSFTGAAHAKRSLRKGFEVFQKSDSDVTVQEGLVS
ncbi:MAG: hypothetical protein ACR2GH_18540 [Pseudonocardia sp.]